MQNESRNSCVKERNSGYVVLVDLFWNRFLLWNVNKRMKDVVAYKSNYDLKE